MPLRVERQGAVALFTIDRPEAKNALDHATFAALRGAVRDAAADGAVRAAILAGEGQTFVSGGDLREMRDKNSREDAERFSDLGFELMAALGEAPFPVIAALTGPAIGGGAELALACDLRVADARARLAFKQVRMGVTTAWGTVPRLVALVGAGVAARLLYTAREIGAAEAKLVGLVDEVTEDGRAREVALAWATEIAQGSPQAVADMKRLVQEATRAPREGEHKDEVRSLERELFAGTWSGPDHREAVEAYFERRAPTWTRRTPR